MLFERKQLRSKLQSLSADLADAAYESAAVRAENEQVRQANHALELSNIRLSGERDQAFAARDQALLERDNAIAERGRAAAGRDEALKEVKHARIQRDEAVAARAEALSERDEALAEVSKASTRSEEALTQASKALARRDEALAEAAGALAARDEALTKANTALAQRDEAVVRTDRALQEKEAAVAEARDAIAERNRAFAERDEVLPQLAAALQARDQMLGERNAALAERGAALQARQTALAERDAAFAERDAALQARQAALAERDAASAERDAALQARQAALAEREAALAERDAALQTRQTALAERDEARAERDRVSAKLESTAQELERSLSVQAEVASFYQANLAEQSRLSEYLRDGLNRLQSSVMDRGCRIRTPYYYLGRGRGLTHLSTGHPFFIATNDRAISPWVLMGGVHETFADDIVTSYVVPGMTIVDVGANMGYYTVKWGSLIGPDGVLHAFEPNPELLDVLRANVTINALQFRCHVHPVAAGSAPGRGKLTFNYDNLGKAGFDQEEIECTHEVQIDAIDNVLPSLQRADLFKIDTEGFEPEVLKGAAKLISRSPDCAFHIETQPSWERFGSMAEILEPILPGRRLFVICHNKTLMPIELAQLPGYVRQTPHKMADLFICPEAPEFMSRVDRFVVDKYLGEADVKPPSALEARKPRTRKRRSQPKS